MAPSPVVVTKTSRSALAWTPIIAATVVVAARVFVRVKRQALGTDDHLMVLSLLLALISAGLAEGLIHGEPKTPAEGGHLNAVSRLASLTGLYSLAVGKASVGYLLLRLAVRSMRWQRYFLVASMAVLAFLTFLITVAVLVPNCVEVARLLPYVACLDPGVTLGYTQAWNFYGVFVDFAYSTLPVTFIYKIHMSTAKKLAVTALLGFGWTAGIFTLLRAVTPYTAWSPLTANFIVRLATAMEQGLVIICGSLATLTPLYQYWFKSKPLSPYNGPSQSTTWVASHGNGPQNRNENHASKSIDS